MSEKRLRLSADASESPVTQLQVPLGAAITDEFVRLERDVAAWRKKIIIAPMQNPSAPVPDPSDSEVRLATEKIFPMLQQKVSVEGIRRMQERIADLEQKIASWNRILEQHPSDESARKCLAADTADLRDATTRLREYQLESVSQN